MAALIRERVATGLPINPTAMATEQPGATCAVHRRLGGWDAVYRHVGVKPKVARGKPRRLRLSLMGLPGETFAERVRLRRQKLRLTQAGLAEQAGLSVTEVEYIEAGKRGNGNSMQVGTMAKLAEALQTTIDALVN